MSWVRAAGLVALGCLMSSLALASVATPAAPPSAEVRSLLAEWARTRQAGDRAAALATAQRMTALDRSHPVLRAAHARALAAVGREGEAVAEIAWLAGNGYGLDPRAQADLQALLAEPRHAALRRRLADAVRPVGSVGETVRVQGVVESEGVAYDHATGRFYLGSGGKLMAVATNGSAQVLHDGDGGWGIAGVRVDAASGDILFCANPEPGGPPPALVVVDRGGGPAKEIRPLGGGAQFCNDIALLGGGEAVVTDTGTGRLRLHRRGQPLKPFTDVVFASPNGVVYAPDRRQLFVADFMGVWALDREGRLVGRLNASGGAYLGGIDGLYFVGDRLIGIQNIIAPERIVSIRLQGGLSAEMKVLAAGQPELAGMTTAALVGSRLAVLGRGPSETPAATLIWVDMAS